MFGIGSRTWYAEWHDIVFNFEWKRDRDYFLEHAENAKMISASDVYKNNKMSNSIRIYCSDISYRNKDRRERIKKWYDNK